MAKLTIVTITYNHEKFIKKALDSFLMQKTNFDFEVLVGDDCSTDSTPKILKEYAKKYPKIIKIVLNPKNIGAMENYVKTLGMVRSEYVAICDGDDYWSDENKLQKQVDFLDTHKDYSICFHQTRIFFENGSKPDEVAPHDDFKADTDINDLLKECYIPSNSVVYRWEFRKIGTLEKVFPKDMVPGDYYMHLLHANAGKIRFINEVMSCYRRHEGGVWWLTSQPAKQDDFFLKYGVKYLNFFKHVEENFFIDKKIYFIQKNYLASNMIRCYLERNMFDSLFDFSKTDKELFDLNIKNFSYAPVYKSLPKFKKMLYLIFIDQKSLKIKLIEKANSKSKIWFPWRAIYKTYKFIKRKDKNGE